MARSYRSGRSACVFGVAIAMACGAFPATQASGATLRWINANGGLFADPANWDPAQVPVYSTDTAVFDLAASYTVSGVAEAFGMRMDRGNVTFDGEVSVSSLGFDLFGGEAIFNDYVSVEGNGYAQWTVATGARATVNQGGRWGELHVDGELRVVGGDHSFSSMNSDGSIDGALFIEDGGELFTGGSGAFEVGGSVKVTGAGSAFRPRSTTITGLVEFEDGAIGGAEIWNLYGKVSATDATVSSSILFEANPGSVVSLTNGALVTGGEYGFTQARLDMFGVSRVDKLTRFANSILRVELTPEALRASGPMITGGLDGLHFDSAFSGNRLYLIYSEGFLPSAGESLHLARLSETDGWNASEAFGLFSQTAFPSWLSAELEIVPWGTSGHDIFITFSVPSPGGLAAFAVVGAIVRRRRAGGAVRRRA